MTIRELDTRRNILIACSCDWGCPCNVNGRPTTGDCEGGWTWQVETERYEDVSLDGVAFSVLADWPGTIHEGGGKAVAYVDDRTDGEQRRAVTTLVRGGSGGPWSIFITTYELDGPHPAAYEVEIDGERSRYRIGDLVTKGAAPLRSKVFRVADGIAYDHSGRYGAVGSFSYTG